MLSPRVAGTGKQGKPDVTEAAGVFGCYCVVSFFRILGGSCDIKAPYFILTAGANSHFLIV